MGTSHLLQRQDALVTPRNPFPNACNRRQRAPAVTLGRVHGQWQRLFGVLQLLWQRCKRHKYQ